MGSHPCLTTLLCLSFSPASANICNVVLMRYGELEEGIDVLDADGSLVGSSKIAARHVGFPGATPCTNGWMPLQLACVFLRSSCPRTLACFSSRFLLPIPVAISHLCEPLASKTAPCQACSPGQSFTALQPPPSCLHCEMSPFFIPAPQDPALPRRC